MKKTFFRSVISLYLCAVLVLSAGCASQSDLYNANHLHSDDHPSDLFSAAQMLVFSCDSGIYDVRDLKVTIAAPEGYNICYTIDGTIPGADDSCRKNRVTVSLNNNNTGYLISNRDLMICHEDENSVILDSRDLPKGRVLRAAVSDPDGNVSEPQTRVYFLNPDFYERFPDCLVISVTIDPEDLLDHDSGILVPGAVFDRWKQTEEGMQKIHDGLWWEYETNSTQRGREWERSCEVQIFDGEAYPSLTQAAGIRITGGMSRRVSQKSFNMYFRDEYSGELKYEMFPGMDSLTGFRLRAGGNNTDHLKFKDAFLMELSEGRNAGTSMSRAAVLFLNGEYWGPYILSEKITPLMFSYRYGIEEGSVVIIKEGKVEAGSDEDIELYNELMEFAEMDLTDADSYRKFCDAVDIRSFADYCATRIYIGDQDWTPTKNDLLWRTRDDSYDSGRWHFMLYDIENSSGLYGYENTAPETDHFSRAIEQYPLFRAAIRNQEFYELFSDSIREIGSENFLPERVEAVMQSYLDIWQPLMPDYYRRFGDTSLQWESSINNTVDFFRKRYEFIIPVIENNGH